MKLKRRGRARQDHCGSPSPEVLVRRYKDAKLDQEMALCVLVEETDVERNVITLYKTSQPKKYLEGPHE
jgi:hypothetical protein